MSAKAGRLLIMKINSVAVAGVKTKSVAINREPIDITSDDDDGYRTLLETPGMISLDLSVSGVTKDATFRAHALEMASPVLLEDVTLEYPDGSQIEGDFFMPSYSESGETAGAITFDATLQSSGTIVYTPASP